MMEKTEYEGWPNCVRLFNQEIEIIVTTDVGPRIIHCGLKKGHNLLYVSGEDKGRTGGSQWRIYGGHRLWHAPEAMPRSYYPDNFPVNYTWKGKTLILSQDIETTTRIIKEMEITLHPEKNQVTVLHRLINKNLWPIEISPWAITAHAAGGKAILPQEPFIDPSEYLLPARPVVLWYYTQMRDARWIWGDKYIQLLHDPAKTTEQKIGILNKQGWAAYLHDKTLMIKKFQFDREALYPDYGCNNEVYVNENLLEIETLGPLSKIDPGNAVELTEQWFITTLEQTIQPVHDDGIDRNILPVIRSFMI